MVVCLNTTNVTQVNEWIQFMSHLPTWIQRNSGMEYLVSFHYFPIRTRLERVHTTWILWWIVRCSVNTYWSEWVTWITPNPGWHCKYLGNPYAVFWWGWKVIYFKYQKFQVAVITFNYLLQFDPSANCRLQICHLGQSTRCIKYAAGSKERKVCLTLFQGLAASGRVCPQTMYGTMI